MRVNLKLITLHNISEYGVKLEDNIQYLNCFVDVINTYKPSPSIKEELLNHLRERVQQLGVKRFFTVTEKTYKGSCDILVETNTSKNIEFIKGKEVVKQYYNTYLECCSCSATYRYIKKELLYKCISLMFPKMYEALTTKNLVNFLGKRPSDIVDIIGAISYDNYTDFNNAIMKEYEYKRNTLLTSINLFSIGNIVYI